MPFFNAKHTDYPFYNDGDEGQYLTMQEEGRVPHFIVDTRDDFRQQLLDAYIWGLRNGERKRENNRVVLTEEAWNRVDKPKKKGGTV